LDLNKVLSVHFSRNGFIKSAPCRQPLTLTNLNIFSAAAGTLKAKSPFEQKLAHPAATRDDDLTCIRAFQMEFAKLGKEPFRWNSPNLEKSLSDGIRQTRKRAFQMEFAKLGKEPFRWNSPNTQKSLSDGIRQTRKRAFQMEFAKLAKEPFRWNSPNLHKSLSDGIRQT
jgi:hypothetical protein